MMESQPREIERYVTSMQDVKIPVSDSYHNYLIASLKDPEEAAAYLEVALEEDPEPKLLLAVLEDIIKAFSADRSLSDETLKKSEILYHLLTISSCAEIYNFVELVNLLGFKISIQIKESETAGNEK